MNVLFYFKIDNNISIYPFLKKINDTNIYPIIKQTYIILKQINIKNKNNIIF